MIPLNTPKNIALVSGFLAAPSEELRERLKFLAYLRTRPGLEAFSDEIAALVRAELDRRAGVLNSSPAQAA